MIGGNPKGDALKSLTLVLLCGIFSKTTLCVVYKLISQCIVMMYANDHQAFTFGRGIEDLESILNYNGKEMSH